MTLSFHIENLSYPTKTPFRISRSSVNEVHVVQVTLQNSTNTGRGECRPYQRYDETVESVTAELENYRDQIETGDVSSAIASFKHGGAARNALEAAWLDLQAKAKKCSVASLMGVNSPGPRQTAFTLSWGTVAEMVAAAQAATDYPWLKIKIGKDGLKHVLAVGAARPDAQLIIDANEALTEDELPDFLDALADLNIALIEQPLPAGHAGKLPQTDLTICADEGLHSVSDLSELWNQGYRAVNVKLDKCGGPIAALELITMARDMGFKIMAGCMVGSSLAMAPMLTLESLCDVIDLDGALLLARDIDQGLIYKKSTVYPPTSKLWG